MFQALRQNFGLKLFSLALAIGGWAYFRFLAAPSITSPFDDRLAVPIGRNASGVAQHVFPLSVSYAGNAGSLVVDKLDVSPPDVSVNGALSDLRRIRAIRVEVPVPTEASTYDAMVQPQLVAPGVDPRSLEITPNLVRVRVSFIRAGT
ncbi:MAG: hypothetical protein ACRENA_13740 [Vulcanimicrobiaceae bacterium]